MCSYKWRPTIGNHIYRKSCCPNCSGKALWTFDRFILKAKEVHGDKYDYSEIIPDDIQGVKSHIMIICKTCNHKWSPSIGNHINSSNGCPSCAGNITWTLERFLHKAYENHGYNHNYNRITINMIKT